MPKKITTDNIDRDPDLDPRTATPHPDDIDDPGEDDDMRRAAEADAAGEEDDEEDAPPAKKAPVKKAPAKKAAKEEEEDDEEEDDEEEDDEEEDDAPAKKNTVPYDRFKKVNDRRRAAETRTRELESALSKIQSNQSETQKAALDKAQERLDNLYEDVEKARLAGDTREAARLQKELDAERDKLTTKQAAQLSLQQALRVQDTEAYNARVEELAAVDSRFDDESDDFDEDLVAEVNNLVASFERDGQRLTMALRRAVKYATGQDILGPKKLEREPPKTPLKRTTDTRKNAEAARRTPDDIVDTSSQRARPVKDIRALIRSGDIDSLSEAELDKMAADLSDGDDRSARGGRYSEPAGKRTAKKSR